MGANNAKFLVSVADNKAECFTVTKFTGYDAISRPYRFDIEFELSGRGKPEMTAAALLNKPCHFKVVSDSGAAVAAYHGVVREFCETRKSKPTYSVRLVPWIELLSLNINNRVFQKNTAVAIIQKVIQEAVKDTEFKECCKFKIGGEGEAKYAYPEIDFCVQHQETDLNFISRLMEQNGIWYYIEESGEADADKRKDFVVITDSFAEFPKEAIEARFVEEGTGSGANPVAPLPKASTGEAGGRNENAAGGNNPTEKVGDGGAAGNDNSQPDNSGENNGYVQKTAETLKKDSCDFPESIHSMSSKSAIIPQSVHLRAYNYRKPEDFLDGKCNAAGVDGARGSVYEYGGTYKDSKEAERGAELYLRRLKVENMRTTGKSNCKAFRAGRLVKVTFTPESADTFLLVSVSHRGGGNDTHNYNNTFSCVNANAKIYAPPLRAVQPRAGGLITAKVDALGDEHPSLDETGRYKVKMPFDLSQTGEFAATKYIRLSLPSGGKSGGETYGLHLPSKRGAEMVLAYIDGNPDKPIGLGFVPNGGTPSPANSNISKDLNVIRTWGGNELVMDDTPGMEKVILASRDIPPETPSDANKANNDGNANNTATTPPDAWNTRLKQRMENYSGKNGTEMIDQANNSELVFDNAQKLAVLRALKHRLVMACKTENSSVTIITENKHIIKIDDKEQKITVSTAKGNTLEMNDRENTVTIRDAGNVNTVTLGKKLSIESKGNVEILASGEISIKGKNVKIASGGGGIGSGGGTPSAVSSTNGNSPQAAPGAEPPPSPPPADNAPSSGDNNSSDGSKVEPAAEVAATPANEAEPVAKEESEAIVDEKVYKKGDKGNVVLEINIRLAGFSGLVPDYEFSDRTERGVIQFQEDYMKVKSTGIVDYATLEKIDEFSKQYDISQTVWNALKCSCKDKGKILTAECNGKKELNNCKGWGSGYGKGEYRDNSKAEAKHNYEYPGIHRSLLFALKALLFYLKDTESEYSFALIPSGYRCHFDKRKTTNHQGKAIDIQFNKGKWAIRGPEKKNIAELEAIRKKFFDKCLNAKTNWTPSNHFGLEPIGLLYYTDKKGETQIDPNYSYSWIHLDVREFNQDYLRDDLFCKDSATLNGVPMTEIK